jgi:VanZ family protein
MTLPESRDNIAMQEGPRPVRPVRPVAAVVIVAAAAAVAWLVIREVCAWKGAPYNVRELFPSRHREVYQATFAVLLVWIGFGPAWVGGLLVRRPGLVKLMPIWSAMVGLASWVLLRLSVTMESLADILGSPVLGWGGDWEFICRFIGLQSIVSLVLIVAAVTVGGVNRLGFSGGLKRGAAAGLWALPWLCLAWVSVRVWSRTDNLVELIRHEPFKWAGPACLTAGVALVGLHVSALGHAFSRRTGRSGVVGLLAVIATPVAVVGAWAMAYLGLDPAVTKYRQTFPALRFLLAPDRKSALSWNELFLRFCGAEISATAMLVCGSAAALLLWPRRPDVAGIPGGADQRAGGAAAPRHAGRAMLVMTVIYVGLLFYGSLMPFDFRGISFRTAWDAFWHTHLVLGARWSQSDMVTNVTMTIPLTFLALGAWSREGARRGAWYMAPAAFVGSVAVSVCLEFSQVFTANRSASIHDIIAQAIGAVIGLTAWLLAGEPLCRWIRGLSGNLGRAGFARRILWAYAGALVFYELMPFTPTISASQIMARFNHGMINLVPFGDRVDLVFSELVIKAALYAPIGFLAAMSAGMPAGPSAAASAAPRAWRRVLRAILCGLAFSLALETLQIFIVSRYATSSDVVLGTLGSAGGGVFACLAAAWARYRGGKPGTKLGQSERPG